MFLFLAGLVGGGEGWAAVRLPKLVGDRMVLQRETELKIWGWADPGEKVTVRFEVHLIIQKPTGREMARHAASATARRTVSDGSE